MFLRDRISPNRREIVDGFRVAQARVAGVVGHSCRRTGRGFPRREIVGRHAELAFALTQYRTDHNAYPASLADLVPQCRADVPRDRFADSELHYRQESKGYLLYSVGINGKDDSGRTMTDRNDADNAVEWDDLVIRMPAK